MSIFRRGPNKHALTVVMTGVKLGDRLLQIGCSDGSLLASIAAKVGFSGRACAIVPSDEDAAKARVGAENAGVLLELERAPLHTLPYADGSFDLVVVDNLAGLLAGMKPEERVALLQAARRTIARRGRLLIIERAPRGGLGSLFRTVPVDPIYERSGGAIGALEAEGFRAVRKLAERDGLSFFEGSL
jgi:ubiquinone/menaquinone biosynthesis C-methylase UbiE